MAKRTDKLGLYLPGGGGSGENMPDEPADIDKINQNFVEVDDAVGFAMATSTTKPATPYEGQGVYERDTGLIKLWDSDDFEWKRVGGATWDEVTGKPTTFPSTWGTVSGKPATFPPIIGGAANQAVAGNDARLTNARTPTAHKHNASDVDAGVLNRARIPIEIVANNVSITPSAAGASTGVTVTFPSGRFAQAPYVVATPVQAGNTVTTWGSSGTTDSGTTIYGTRTSATAFSMQYVAVGRG